METNAKPTAQHLAEILTTAGFTTYDQVDWLDLTVLRNIAANAGIAKRITARHRTEVLAHFPKPDDGTDPFAGI